MIIEIEKNLVCLQGLSKKYSIDIMGTTYLLHIFVNFFQVGKSWCLFHVCFHM